MVKLSFFDLFKQSLRLIRKDPIIITPLTIYLFLSEFFSVFSFDEVEQKISTHIPLFAIYLGLSTFFKMVVYLATTHILTHEKVDLEKMAVTLKSKLFQLLVVILIITIPSLMFNSWVTIPVFNQEIEPNLTIFIGIIGFIVFSLYSLFLIAFTIHDFHPIQELLVKTWRFMISHLPTILKHVILIIGMCFLLFLALGAFFMIPHLGPVLSVLILGCLFTLFYVYIAIFYHHLRHGIATEV